MIERVSRYLNGYLRIRLTGHNIRRFINLCTTNEIALWDIIFVDEEQYECSISWQDLFATEPHLKKTKTKVQVLSKKGFPLLQKKYRKRYMWFFAIALVLFCFFYLSQRIWKIEITGNSMVSEQEIIRFLDRNHTSFGTEKEQIDCAKLKLQLREEFVPIIWASAHIDGTKLTIEIQENMGQPKETPSGVSGNEKEHNGETIYHNFVAAKDAKIASVITRSGVPLVKAGDSVKAGDLLVRSDYPIIRDDETVREYVAVEPDADILGYVTYQYTEEIPIKQTERIDTGKKARQFFCIAFGKKFTVPFWNPHYECETKSERYVQLHVSDNFYLPFYFGEICCREQEEKEIFCTKEQIKEQAIQHFSNFLQELEENGVLILSKNVMMEKKGKKYYIKGEMKACEDIIQKVKAESVPEQDISQEEAQEQ